jgi:hypothetical protein
MPFSKSQFRQELCAKFEPWTKPDAIHSPLASGAIKPNGLLTLF